MAAEPSPAEGLCLGIPVPKLAVPNGEEAQFEGRSKATHLEPAGWPREAHGRVPGHVLPYENPVTGIRGC